jgi:hypothetical protein
MYYYSEKRKEECLVAKLIIGTESSRKGAATVSYKVM